MGGLRLAESLYLCLAMQRVQKEKAPIVGATQRRHERARQRYAGFTARLLHERNFSVYLCVYMQSRSAMYKEKENFV